MDVILNPTFPEPEVEKEKRMMLSDLVDLRNNNRQLARRFFRGMLFAGHPYGKFSEGKESTIKPLTKKDVEDFYKTYFVTKNTAIAVSGDINKEALEAELPAAPAPGRRAASRPSPPATTRPTRRKR